MSFPISLTPHLLQCSMFVCRLSKQGSYNHRSGSNTSLKDIGKAPVSDYTATDWIFDTTVTHTICSRRSGPQRKRLLYMESPKGHHDGRFLEHQRQWLWLVFVHPQIFQFSPGRQSFTSCSPTVHRARIWQHTRLWIPLTEAKQTIGSFPHGACYNTMLVSGVTVSSNKSRCNPYSPTSTRPRSLVITRITQCRGLAD